MTFEQFKVKTTLANKRIMYGEKDWEFSRILYKRYRDGEKEIVFEPNSIPKKYESCLIRDLVVCLEDMGIKANFYYKKASHKQLHRIRARYTEPDLSVILVVDRED